MSWIRPSTLTLWLQCQAPTSYRHASSLVIKRPSPSATRVAPTPLVFCSAKGWAPRQHIVLSPYLSVLAESGFTCIESHFSRPSKPGVTCTSEELLEICVNDMRANIQTLAYPSPPVIFASGFACLIAQTYISSHPARGLFLISPPLSNASLHPDILPTTLVEFDYELHFPIAVMATSDYMAKLQTQTRFAPSAWVDLIQVENLESDRAVKEAERWVDELGV